MEVGTDLSLRILVLSQFGFREILAQCKTSRAQRAKRHDGVGSRGPLKGPGGVLWETPLGGRGGGAPGISWVLAFYEAQKRVSPALFLYTSCGEKCYTCTTVWNKNLKQVQLKDKKFNKDNITKCNLSLLYSEQWDISIFLHPIPHSFFFSFL